MESLFNTGYPQQQYGQPQQYAQQQYAQQQQQESGGEYGDIVRDARGRYGMSAAEMNMTHETYFVNVTAAEVYDSLKAIQPAECQQLLADPEVRNVARYVSLTLPTPKYFGVIAKETNSTDVGGVGRIVTHVSRAIPAPLEADVVVIDMSRFEAIMQLGIEVNVYVGHPRQEAGGLNMSGGWEQAPSWLKRYFREMDPLANGDDASDVGSSGSMGGFAPTEMAVAPAIVKLLKGLNIVVQ